jgi:hypothetical protein
MAIPPGLTRDDVFVTLDFYTPGPAKLTMRDKKGKKLARMNGEVKAGVIFLKSPYNWGDPGYEIIAINGVTEIMECIPYRDNANMVQNGHIVALFNVIDDLALRKQVLAAAGVHWIESTFNLASESRLPHGIAIPPGLTRDDVSVTLEYIGRSRAEFTLRDKNGKKLATVNGETKGDPIHLNKTDPISPAYQLVVIKGVTEIMECRAYRDNANMAQNGRIVARFNVVDDPALLYELLTAKGIPLR